MPVYGIKNLNDRLHRMRNDLYTKIPKRIGQDAENHFRDSFKKGGFTDRAFVPWKPPTLARTSTLVPVRFA